MKVVLLQATSKSNFTVGFSVDWSPKGRWVCREQSPQGPDIYDSVKSEKKPTNLEVTEMQITLARLILQGEFASFHPDSW